MVTDLTNIGFWNAGLSIELRCEITADSLTEVGRFWRLVGVGFEKRDDDNRSDDDYGVEQQQQGKDGESVIDGVNTTSDLEKMGPALTVLR